MDASPEAQAGSAAVATPDGFFRTPLQVLLLSYASFGIYDYYWLIRGRRIAEDRLGLERTSYWYYLFWLIPFVSVFSGFRCASIIQDRVEAAGAPPPPVPFGVLTVLFFVVDVLYRLPDPFWLICFFSSAFVAAMSVGLARAETLDYPGFTWPRLTAGEWLILIFGGLLLALVLYWSATGVPVASQRYVVGIAAGIVGTIGFFARIKVAKP